MSDFQVKTEGPTRGAWLTTDDGLFNLVSDDGKPGYVGVYAGDEYKKNPKNPRGLPHAMSFADGELMLQIPVEDHPHQPLVVKMKDVKALVLAARGMS